MPGRGFAHINSRGPIPKQWGQFILFSVVFTPSPPRHHGTVGVLSVISLFLTNTTEHYIAGAGAYLYDWRGFVVPKKKTIVDLLVFSGKKDLASVRYLFL
jgi:hypothetical protein